MGSARVQENKELFAYQGYDESSSRDASVSGCFDGFLTIEILGSNQNQLVSEPQTPSFPVENVTQTNPKLINTDKLKDDRFYWNGSLSARTSRVSAAVLSGSSDDGIYRRKYTPLHDMPTECTIVESKNRRPSLRELFQRNRPEEEYSKENYRTTYSARVSNMPMKKFLRRLMLHGGTPADPASAENRLQKALQIFNRKVHPECHAVTQNSQMSHKNESYITNGSTLSHDSNYHYDKNGARSMADDKTSPFPPQSHQTQKEGTMAKDSSTLYANGEYWIKTDADYLVLEL